MTVINFHPIIILPALSKMIESIVYTQIKHDLFINCLISGFQHAYQPSPSRCTALTQLTDHCLQHIDKKVKVGTVLLYFSAAFDLIDHELL